MTEAVGSLPVQGAWIEISAEEAVEAAVVGRSPCRERGLKSREARPMTEAVGSLPVQGAWIEMPNEYRELVRKYVAPRAGSVD